MNIPRINAPTSVISLRIFGSHCRGDSDELSDIDVLAVHAIKPDAPTRQHVKQLLVAAFGKPVDLAEYSPKRLKELFDDGHLFAWHLLTESKNLLHTSDFFFGSLGEPAPYRGAHRDASQFLDLLRSIQVELSKPGSSTVYEAGLAYLATRNIGLCASWLIMGKPDFSRYAIFNVSRQLGLSLATSRAEYRRLIDCRCGTIRGLAIEAPSVGWLTRIVMSLISDCERLLVLERIPA